MTSDIISSALKAGYTLLNQAEKNAIESESEGYSRVDQNLVSVVQGARSVSVASSKAHRAENDPVRRLLGQKKSFLEGVRAAESTYKALEESVGCVGGSEKILSSLLSSLERQLAVPKMAQDRQAYFSSLIRNAQDVAGSLRHLSKSVQLARSEADKGISLALGDVQVWMQRYHEANTAMVGALEGTPEYQGFHDQRDAAFFALSSYLPVYETRDANSLVGRYLHGPQGIPLVTQVGPTHFEFEESGQISAFDSLSGGQLSPVLLYFDRLEQDVTSILSESESKLGVLLKMRDEQLPQLQDMLDEGAQTISDTLNVVHNQGSAYGGRASLESSLMLDAADSWGRQGVLRLAIVDQKGQVQEKKDIHFLTHHTVADLVNEVNTMDKVRASCLDGKLRMQTLQDGTGIALCGLDENARTVLAGLHLNDLFCRDRSQVSTGTNRQGFSADIVVNSVLVNNPQKLAHGQLSAASSLDVGHTGLQQSDARNLKAMASVTGNPVVFDAAGVWTEEQSLNMKDWGRLFETYVTEQRNWTASLLTSAEEKTLQIQQAYNKDIGVDPFDNKADEMKWKQYVEKVMTLLGIQNDLDNTLMSILLRS